MKVHFGGRLFVAAAVLAAVAVCAAGFLVALGVHSVVAGPGASPDPPNPGHGWDRIELPGGGGVWPGLNADLLDGQHFNQIQDADDYVSNAGYCAAAGNADTLDGQHSNQIQDADDYVSNAGYCAAAGNADTLDGQHASAFAGASHSHNTSDISAGTLSTDRYSAIADLNAEGLLGGILPGTMWHSNNDGAASTLDADLLDGQQASAFAGASHNHDATYWKLTGNSGTTPGINYLGTTDDKALELRVNSARALRLEPNPGSPNLIGGYSGNSVTTGVGGATISGGGSGGNTNRVTDGGGTVGGGANNQAGDAGGTTTDRLYATVAGGHSNSASANYATIGGGYTNLATDSYGTVGGGGNNQAGDPSTTAGNEEPYATVAGGEGNIASDSVATVGGGSSNEATSYAATVAGGGDNAASHMYDTVGGGAGNIASGSGSTVAGGLVGDASGSYATVGGGLGNTASGYAATVAGGGRIEPLTPGTGNRATGIYCTVGGGGNNQAGDDYATVGGGKSNTASASYATIGGGGESSPGTPATGNRATDNYCTVGGGGNNQAGDAGVDATSAPYATVGGGQDNTAGNDWASVGGGYSNDASGLYATIPGGLDNTASGDYSFAAGRRARADDQGAFVWADSTDADLNSTAANQFLVRANGGVNMNTTSGVSLNVTSGGLRLESNATSPNVIGGYSGNSVTSGAYGAAICGGGVSGNTNSVTDNYGTVGGGYGNRAGDNAGDTTDRPYATVAGGRSNTASGQYATVGGGINSEAGGNYSTVPGGYDNDTATAASYSFAAGYHAQANNQGCFVWSDSSSASDFTCSTNNRFMARADGGVYLYTKSDLTKGVYLNNGGETWGMISASDRDLKENFTPVDGEAVLASLAEMPITTWNYTTQDDSIRHMGPTAQDFYAAFSLDEDDRQIFHMDADGVALAAIQGLYETVQGLEAENASLQQRLGDVEERLTALEGGAPPDHDSAGPLASIMPDGWLVLGALLVLGGLVLAQRRLAGGRR